MLESILEKVLINNIGPYVNGIDKKNLKVGIWSGDVVIANISIKPEAVEKLGLPVIIKQSHIGKLTLGLNWKSIASRPVEVFLEDVLIVVHPLDKDRWSFDDLQFFHKRMDLVENLVQSYALKILEKAQQGKKEEEDSGMIGRLTEKIIDNIQISIKNIHVRFENKNVKEKFACGITLEEILVCTTNEKWEKQFIDRTQNENKFLPMHKLLSLKNLGVYWCSDTKEIYGDGHAPQVIQNMRNFILRDVTGSSDDPIANARRDDYIIALTATCRLIQKNKKSPFMIEKPEFDVSLQVTPINIHLKKPQLKDMIGLLTLFNQFDRFQAENIQAKQRQLGNISAEERTTYNSQYKELFNKIYRHQKYDEERGEEKLKLTLGNNKDEIDSYKKLIMALPEEDLLKTVKTIVKDVEREKQIKSLNDKKEAEKKGWLGGWLPWGGAKDEIENEKDPVKKEKLIKEAEELRQKELAEIEDYLQNVLGDGNKVSPTKNTEVDEANKNLLALNFFLEGGEIYLSSIAPNKNEEGSKFFLTGLAVSANIATYTKKVSLTLKDYGFVLKTKYVGTKGYIDTPILHRVNHWMPLKDTKSILSLDFEENPKGKEDGMHVNLDLQEVEVIFRAVVIERLTKFFDVTIEDESLKTQAAEKLEQVQNRAAEAANEVALANATVRKYIKVNFAAPVIVIPFLQNGDLKSECWVLHLGKLAVDTKRPVTAIEKIYETYTLLLENFKFQYFPNQLLYNTAQRSLIEKGDLSELQASDLESHKKVFDVLEEFHIGVKVDKMLTECEQTPEGKDKPRMNCEVKIPNINIKLKPDVYSNLLKTTDYLSNLEEVQMVLSEDNYGKLVSNCLKAGGLYVHERRFGNMAWVKYECIFTKGYMYFYKQVAENERPAFIYMIKDAKITDYDTKEKDNAFIIESKHIRAELATDSPSEMQEWTDLLKAKIMEYATVNLIYQSKLQVDFQAEAAKKKAEKEKAVEATKTVDYSVLEMALYFEITQVKLRVLRDEELKLFDFQTDNFKVNLKQYPGKMDVNLKLDAIESRDYLFEYTNPNLKMLLTSVPPGVNADETDDDLIEVQVLTLEKTHPDYNQKKTGMKAVVKIGYFFVNFKPGTLQSIMKFFIPPSNPNSTEVAQNQVEQAVVYTGNDDDILMDIAVEIVTIGVRLVHQTSYACLAELALSDIKMFIIMQALSMEMTGKFDNLQLFDLTNYPDSIDSNVEYEKVRPYELFGALENSKGHSLIELSFKSYDPKHPKADLKDKIFSFVNLGVQSVKINYLQQPILRIIDYLTGQLLPSLKPDGNVVNIIREEAEKILGDPQFMDLNIEMESPIITLKPRPDSTEYIEIRLGDIILKSERVKDFNRFSHALKPLEFVYCERYNIGLKQMGMFKVCEETQNGKPKEVKIEISRNFDFEMYVEMVLFPDELNLIHGGEAPGTKAKIQVDQSMKLGGSMTPMILTIKQIDYLLIMKCLNFNVNYDDLMDRMFVTDFEKMMLDQQQPGPPMVIDLQIENLSIVMLDEEAKPFAMINWHLLDIVINRDEIRRMNIVISGPELNGSFFEYEGKRVRERKLLGSLDERDAFELEKYSHHEIVDLVSDHLVGYVKKVAEIHKHKSKIEENAQKKAKRPVIVDMKMEPNGNKNIKIYVNQLRTYLATSVFLDLQAFTMLDDSVNPPFPDSTFVVAGQSFHNQELPPPGKMVVDIEVDDIEIAIPSSKTDSSKSSNVLAIRGDVSMLLVSDNEPKLSAVIDRSRKFEKAMEQCSTLTEYGRLTLALKEFEIFICDFNDLRTIESFKHVLKRNIILPVELSFSRISHLVPNQNQTALLPVVKNEVSMERIIVRSSYHDILLINKSAAFHTAQLGPKPQENALPEQSQNEISIRKDEPKTDASFKDNKMQGSSGDTSEVNLYGPKQHKKNMEYIPKKDDPSDASALWNGDVEITIQDDENRALNPKQEEIQSVAVIDAPKEKIVEVKEPEGWEANREEYVIASKGIKTVLINDAEGLLVPVLDFSIERIGAQMIMTPKVMKINGDIVFSCNYFNSLPSKWEPILEEFGADFELEMGEDPKMSFALATNKNFETLNINVSESMCCTLLSTMATWKTGFDEQVQKKDTMNRSSVVLSKGAVEEEALDYVSPYSIVNHTGYPILIQADQKPEQLEKAGKKALELFNKIYRIEHDGSAQYRVESDIEELVKENVDDFYINPHKIKVKVLHPSYNFEEITGIDIDKTNVAAHPLVSNRENYILVSEVKVENNKKLIVITSPFRIKNHVDQEFSVLLESKSQSLNLSLGPQKSVAVPLDYINGTISIQDALDDSSVATKTSVWEFFNNQNTVTEIKAGGLNIIGEFTALDLKKKAHKLRLFSPMQIKNCCIQDLQYQITSESNTNGTAVGLKPQQNSQETSVSLSQKVYMQVKAPGFNWSERVLVHSPIPKDAIKNEIVLKDNEGKSLSINVFIFEEKADPKDTKTQGPKKVFLYTKTSIINETPYDLEYYTVEQGKNVKFPGQISASSQAKDLERGNDLASKLAMMNQCKGFVISRKNTKETSKNINVSTVGQTVAELLNENGSSMLELGIDVVLTPCDAEHHLLTKVITISPRYVVINQTDCTIELKREKTSQLLLSLDKDQRTPLYWNNWETISNKKKANDNSAPMKSIAVHLVYPGQDPTTWNWSNPFDITSVGAYNFYVKSKDGKIKFLRATISLQASVLYVLIDDEEPENVTYRIRNDTNLPLRIHQATVNPAHGFIVSPKETIPWAWTFPNKKKEVLANFIIDDSMNYHSSDMIYSFDNINQLFDTQVPLGKDQAGKMKVRVSVTFEAKSRILRFYVPLKVNASSVAMLGGILPNATKPPVAMDIEIGIKSIGISIISSTEHKKKQLKKRSEVLYILMRGLEVKLLDTTDTTSYQLRLKYLNIDNNTKFDTMFPVLLTPTNPGDLDADSKEYFLDTLITQKNTSEISFYETIQFLLNTTSLNVDGPFIDSMIEVADNFTQALVAKDESEEFQTITEGLYKNIKTTTKLQDQEFFESKLTWKISVIEEFKGNLFIKNLVIHPFFFNLSFKLKKLSATENSFVVLNLLTSSVGSALANLDKAPLSLTGIQLKNVFDSQEAITQKIVSKYKDEVAKNVLKLLGSIDIIGNPVGLFKNISTGVVDLFEKPMEGFLKGPLEGGKGLVKGAGSLVKNTVSGAFNSISKVTGSLGTGVSNLSLDDEYLEEREKLIMKRPKHIGQGLMQGAHSLGHGIFGGLTGIFVKPCKGVQSGGCKGLAKGTYQGVSGIVVKPVAGLLDATSKTAEGIKNTATYWDKKANEERLRLPRPFYGKEKFYRTYRLLDAQILAALRDQKEELKDVALVSSIDVYPDESDPNSLQILAVTFGPVVYWHIKKKKIIWSFNPEDVEKAEIFEGELRFHLNKPAKGINEKFISMKNPDQSENEFVYKKVLELKELYTA